MCATSTVSARRGCVEEVQKVEFAGYVFVINLLYRLLECPIGLRPPSNRIAFAVQSDCVRRPIRLRPPSDQIAFAIYSYNHRLYTLSIKSYSNTYCCLLRRPETSATVFVCTDSLSSTAYCCRFAILCLRVESVSEAQVQIVVI